MLDKLSSPGVSARTHEQMQRQARTLRVWAMIVLIPVAVIGAALSFQSLYRAAVPVFGTLLALGFPLLVDFLILGASLQYVAGAKTGRPRAGWRWTAHAGVAGTLALNAMAAQTPGAVPWHVTAPAVWSVLVELAAREVLGQWRAVHAPPGDRIPLRLWMTAPLESARTWLRIARRVEGEQAHARLDVGVHAAAVEALKLALPQRRARRVRRILQRQLRAGSLPPSAILGPLGWMDATAALTEVTPEAILRAALRDTLRSSAAIQPGNPVADGAGREPAGRQDTLALSSVPVPSGTEPVGEGSDTPAARPEAVAPLSLQRAATTQRSETRRPAPTTSTRRRIIDLTDPPIPVDAPPTHPAPASSREAVTRDTEDRAWGAEPSPETPAVASTGDRFADAVDIVRVHESIGGTQLATQLRGLGWQLSDRTASRILTEVRAHLQQLDPWALPTP